MEVMKTFSSYLGFLQKNMGSSLHEAVGFEPILDAQRSLACLLMMTQFVLKDADVLPTPTGNDQSFPFAELHRREKTDPEAKDGSDTEDDDEDDEDAEEPEDDAGDEDFSEDDDEEEQPPAKKRK
ncbi:hypothetical protein Hdeb2414_s0020g00556951 [Helianthus debilis subsp. tardiflorus]